MSPRKKRLHIFICALVVMTSMHRLLWAQQSQPRQTIVLKGATLIDGTGRAPIPDSVIVIEGDKVKTVGGMQTAYPAGATVVDMSGKFVIPGLVDSHVHYQRWLGELLLNYGITTVMSMQSRDGYGEEF